MSLILLVILFYLTFPVFLFPYFFHFGKYRHTSSKRADIYAGPSHIRVKAAERRTSNIPTAEPAVSIPLVRPTEDNRRPHFLPPQEGGQRDPGDTIDLSKIGGGGSSFEIAIGDTKPANRLRVTPEHLLQNSIDRFDAFGDYEYIGI